jgi:flavin reductase (DIM6/NTAB) family NADH-FMN oxidoreductase RutF
MKNHIAPVELSKAYRLLNHGPTVLVSSRLNGVNNVMAAAWSCVLDFMPPKLTVVIDSETKTREMIEKTQIFGIQIPTVAQTQLTTEVGTVSLNDDSEKLQKAQVELFQFDDFDLPFVAGCSGWMACKLIPEPHIQNQYDLFIGEIIGAWADTRVFKDGRWHFETSDPSLRSIHHVAGGHYYAIGESFPPKSK